MHELKLSLESWREPEQAEPKVLTVMLPVSIFLLNVTEIDASTLMLKVFSAGWTEWTSGVLAMEVNVVSSAELVVLEEDPVELLPELLQPLKITVITGSRKIKNLIFMNTWKLH